MHQKLHPHIPLVPAAWLVRDGHFNKIELLRGVQIVPAIGKAQL